MHIIHYTVKLNLTQSIYSIGYRIHTIISTSIINKYRTRLPQTVEYLVTASEQTLQLLLDPPMAVDVDHLVDRLVQTVARLQLAN